MASSEPAQGAHGAPVNDNRRGAPKPPPKGAAPLAIAAAAAIGMLATWEGKVNDPHWDRYARIHDVCYGETTVAMRHYSDGECLVMLERREGQFQAAVLKINPRLREDPYQLAAHTTFTYNLGVGTYRKSSVARLYAAGRERAACEAMKQYRKAGGQVVKGLVLRRGGDPARVGEYELCMWPYNGVRPGVERVAGFTLRPPPASAMVCDLIPDPTLTKPGGKYEYRPDPRARRRVDGGLT